MKKSPLFIKLNTLAFLLSFSNKVFAEQNQDIINQQDWLSRQQQNIIEENKRFKEQEEIIKERNKKNKQIKQSNELEKSILDQSKQCFKITLINLIGANSLSKKDKDKLTKPFIGRCFYTETLSEIITKIQNFYNSKGYIIATVSLPKQNIQNGNLELKILEGKIDEIIIGNNQLSNRIEEITAFPFLEGKILNIEDINQGIYQINRLPSNNATMKIEPAIQEGEAKVYITNERNFPARATISYDNLGNSFSGLRRTNFSGSIDNLFSLNDSINIIYSTNLNDDNQKKDSKSFTSGISIPFGYTTFSYDYSRSEFRGLHYGANQPIRLSGFSSRNSFSLEYLLLSKGNLRFLNNLSLTSKSSASYLNDEKIETSQRKLTIGTIGFTISDYFKNGISFYLKPSYSKGLKILNAQQDQKNISNNTPKAQFDYFKFYTSLSKKFIIPKIEFPFIFASELDSQYAKQTLYGTEQFSVGGYYSVRGFRENYITGDSGYYLRNKINFNL